MRRGNLLLGAALSIVAAACATTPEAEPGLGTNSPVTTSAITTSPVAEAPATTSPVTTNGADELPTVDGDPAPDFHLALDGGDEFTLSGEQKPVYMIFWAEW